MMAKKAHSEEGGKRGVRAVFPLFNPSYDEVRRSRPLRPGELGRRFRDPEKVTALLGRRGPRIYDRGSPTG